MTPDDKERAYEALWKQSLTMQSLLGAEDIWLAAWEQATEVALERAIVIVREEIVSEHKHTVINRIRSLKGPST